jgi:O-antigen/teichoic acid export membrane protein
MWVFGGQVGVAIAGLVSIKVLTHLLNPYEFGRLSIANIVILLISVNVFGPIGQGLMRYWSISQKKNEFANYISASAAYIKILVIFSALIAFFWWSTAFFSVWRDWTWLIVLSILSGALIGWSGIRLSSLIAARKRKNVAIMNVLSAFAKPMISAVFIILIGIQADFAVLGYLSVACVSTFFAELYFRKAAAVKLINAPIQKANLHNQALGKLILSFSYPFFIWSFFAWAHQSCDRWALLTFQGAQVVGAYSVIAQLAYYPLVFGSGFLSNFFIPIAYERAGGLQTKEAVISGNKILLAMVCLYIAGSVILTLLFYFFHRPLVLLISNENFVQYSYFLPLLTAAWSLYYLGQILSGFGLLANKPSIYIKPVLFCGILATILVFYLASISGVLGIIWALGITGLVYASWCMLIAKKLIDVQKAI